MLACDGMPTVSQGDPGAPSLLVMERKISKDILENIRRYFPEMRGPREKEIQCQGVGFHHCKERVHVWPEIIFGLSGKFPLN